MKLIEKIKLLGVSVAELSMQTGIPSGRIYKWYQGVGNPKSDDSTKLEKYLTDREAAATKDTSALSYKLDEVLSKLGTLKQSFHELDLTRKQLFLKVVLSGSGSFSDGNWTTAGLHPLFADKALKLKELGLLEINKASGKDALFEESMPERTCGQLTFDELSGLLGEIAAVVA